MRTFLWELAVQVHTALAILFLPTLTCVQVGRGHGAKAHGVDSAIESTRRSFEKYGRFYGGDALRVIFVIYLIEMTSKWLIFRCVFFGVGKSRKIGGKMKCQ